jgi:hypothetical protein
MGGRGVMEAEGLVGVMADATEHRAVPWRWDGAEGRGGQSPRQIA